jgi:hypothetical protein
MRLSPAVLVRRTFAFLFFLACSAAFAAPAGQVTNLSGPLFAVAADGTRRVLSVGSSVESGETLITEGNTYAQVRFLDRGVVTLKPGTQFRIESFAFDEKAPEKDGAVFGLFKGALRTVTGLIGKRGNQDAYKMNTATATIGIRGTHFLVEVVPEEESALSFVPYALPPLAALGDMETMFDVPTGLLDLADLTPFQLAQAPGLLPGTYVSVLEGLVAMRTLGVGGLSGPPVNFTAGMAGHAPVFRLPNVAPPPPRPVPPPPTPFTPPPSFQTSQSQAQQAPPGSPPPSPPAPPSQQSGCDVR